MPYTKEIVAYVYDDNTGEKVYVGPDGDALGLVDLRYYAESGKETVRLTIPPEQAVLIAEAILELYGKADIDSR